MIQRHLLILTLALAASPCFADKEPPVETLTIPEITQQAMTLDQKKVRLKFYYRQGINQIDPDHYWVRVFDLDYSNICVVFPKEGLNFFKHITPEEDASKKFRYHASYGTTAGSSTYIYVTAKQFTDADKPSWWAPYSYNSKTSPMLYLDAISKSASKSISGETTYKW